MSRKNVEALRSVYEAWAVGDFSPITILDEHLAFIVRPGFPTEGVFIGLDQLAQHMSDILEAWERMTITAESFREAGDSVLVDVRQVGVGAESGALTEMTYFQVWTFRAGTAIRIEVILDEAEALDAVGLRDSGSELR